MQKRDKKDISPILYFIGIVIIVGFVSYFFGGEDSSLTGQQIFKKWSMQKESLASDTNDDTIEGDWDSGTSGCSEGGGGSPGQKFTGSQACEKSLEDACNKAKKKATEENTEKIEACNTACIEKGYRRGYIKCPDQNACPATHPFTCYTLSKSGDAFECTATTVTKGCTCQCTGKLPASSTNPSSRGDY